MLPFGIDPKPTTKEALNLKQIRLLVWHADISIANGVVHKTRFGIVSFQTAQKSTRGTDREKLAAMTLLVMGKLHQLSPQ